MRTKISKRLATTSAFMLLIFVLALVSMIKQFDEQDRIASALVVSQYNRDCLLKTEAVTQSLLLVENRFNKYCFTFEKTDYDEYKSLTDSLLARIESLRKLHDGGNEKRELNLVDEKTREVEVFKQLKQLIDSLVFSSFNIQVKHAEVEELAKKSATHIIVNKIDEVVDTVSVTKVVKSNRKGLIGRVKTFFVGEKKEESVTTDVVVRSSGATTTQQSDSLSSAKQVPPKIKNTLPKYKANNNELLALKLNELRQSESRLIEISNQLLNEISTLVGTIKDDVKIREASQNDLFLGQVGNSASFIRNVFVGLVVLAILLAIYIMLLAFKNDKSQVSILALNKQVSKESAEKDKYISILSHDLINPLSSMLGFCEILQVSMEEGNKEESTKYVSIIHQSIEQTLDLLQNLLTWSRAQNGKIIFVPQLVNINTLIFDSLQAIRPFANEKSIEIQSAVEGDINMKVDKIMLRAVMRNLLVNAVKFTPKGQSIGLKTFAGAGFLNIIISDTGMGMSAEQLENLFVPSGSSSTPGTEGEVGTGLGLAICKEFVEKHDGEIWAESQLGEGSRFFIRLPIH